MRLVALFLLFAVSASAQTPESAAAQRSFRSHPVTRILVGAAVSVGTPALLGVVGADEAAVAGLVAIPLTAALAVHYIETDGSGHFGRTLVGAGLGALAGGAVLGAGRLVCEIQDPEECIFPLLPGGVALVFGPAIGAGLRYRGSSASAAPVVLVGPDGERAAGLALRVHL